jgi:preprotein translocase subunit SecE
VARLVRFLREVVAELTKVIWPTRTDLITYTIVVIIFVAIMISIVAGLDLGFARAVVAVFG